MPAHNEAEIRARLADWTDAALGTDLASAGVLQAVEIRGDAVTLRLHYPFPVARYRREVESALRKQLAIPNLEVIAESAVEPQAVQGGMSPFPHIRNIIAIASGKGGVGKSTTAVNLAIALADEGARVGILDADIYGPSQPQMLGLSGKPVSHDGKTMQAMQAHGVKCMSIGFLVDTEQPMIWRGPMVSQALTQLLHETDWGELDYLVVDMPPGTGDTQLTMSQRVPLAGAVIVTTPQDIALLDARRGLKMFEKVAVPVLGIVENMSTHICSQCGHEEAIFGADGGRKMAEQYAVPLLGSLPLDIRIRSEADSGHPTVVADPDGELAARYRAIARRMVANLGLRENSQGGFPEITEDNT